MYEVVKTQYSIIPLLVSAVTESFTACAVLSVNENTGTVPCRVGGLILRAMCLMRPQEIDWMYRGGAAGVGALQPAAWAAFLAPLSPAERTDPLAAWHARLTSSDPAVRDAAVGSHHAVRMGVRAEDCWSSQSECTSSTQPVHRHRSSSLL